MNPVQKLFVHIFFSCVMVKHTKVGLQGLILHEILGFIEEADIVHLGTDLIDLLREIVHVANQQNQQKLQSVSVSHISQDN